MKKKSLLIIYAKGKFENKKKTDEMTAKENLVTVNTYNKRLFSYMFQRCFCSCLEFQKKERKSKMSNEKRTVYAGGLAEEVTEKLLHDAFIPFGDIVEIQMPM